MKKTLIIIALLCWLPVFGWANYEIVDLGTVGGDSSFSSAINQRGDVTGYSFDKAGYCHSFIWGKGHLKSFYPISQSFDLNDRGLAVGTFATANLPTQACLWQKDNLQLLGTLGGEFSYANAINNRCQVVGGAAIMFNNWSIVHPFLWYKNVMIDLSPCVGFGWSSDINDVGQVVGMFYANGYEQAFLWQDGTMRFLCPGYATGINNQGKVVGCSVVNQRSYAFVWKNGTIIPLDSLGGSAWAIRINERGQIIGLAESNEGLRAVLWEEDVIIDLNDCLNTSEWILLSANDINNRGQICCRGKNLQTGETHALLLNPH